MIGTRLTARRRVSWGAIVWFLIAALLGAGGILGQEEPVVWGLLALGAFLIGLALWLTRPEGLSVEITPEGLECRQPLMGLVPYDQIEGIVVPRAESLDGEAEIGDDADDLEAQFPIVVRLDDRDFVIPARFDGGSSAKVARFLRSQIPPSGSRRVNPEMAEYLEEQVAAFGEDRVRSYRANLLRDGRQSKRRTRAVCLALFAAGVAFSVGGSTMPEETGGPLLGFGFLFITFSLLGLLLNRFSQAYAGNRIKGIAEASLVVGPVGLALIQGPLRGEMTWDELRGVKSSRRSKSSRKAEHVVPPVQLKLDGATVPIYDVYDRPLPEIEAQILRLWR
jgi:hypothetical protein